MSTYRKVDPSTLGWVKNEIDETLKQARLALEGFVENPADRTRLRFCVTHLHQVVGTLLMVELDGGAWLAREVESLAEAVLEEKVDASDAVLETLTHGILVLPEYLARLQYGHPDVPLRHLALMNQLRDARKATPVEPLELFDPDLSVRPPPAQITERLSDVEYAGRARALRAEYQTALLHWLRGPADSTPLGKIATIVDELKEHAPLSVLEQLFWAAGGLLEALIDGSLEATSDRKKHLARLDQQIKKIIDGTEKSALRSTSEHLVRALLFDIGQSRGSGERVTQLKRAFSLDMLLGTAAQEEMGEVYDLPTPEVLESVAKALGKEIEQAQDILSTAFETQPFDGAALTPLAELLHKMSGTLDMLGVGILRALVDELTATCQAMINGRIAHAAAASMPMAQALLLVESGARDIHASSTDWKQQIEHAILLLKSLQSGAAPTTDGIEVTDAELTDAEFRQLLGVVGDEIGVNLAKVEEALEAFAASANQPAKLDEVPKQLAQIQGALQILGLERAMQLAGATKDYVEAVRAGRLATDSAVLDGLAVCVGTIGAYVEGLRAGRKNLDALLDTAAHEMDVAVAGRGAGVAASSPVVSRGGSGLRPLLDAWLAAPQDEKAATAVHDAMNELTGRDDVGDRAKAGRIAAEMQRLMQIVADDPAALSPEVKQTLIASCGALVDACAPATKSPAPKAPAPAPAAAAATQTDEEFDEEIMQIFIEDARDVYGNITREFATWRNETGNAQALAELRRGYHTLKGSGRMVGASDIAELAWAVENMLNHVRDGKIEATPAVIDVVERSQAVLPAMIATLEGGPATDADIGALREAAQALVEKRPVAPGAKPAPTASKPELPRIDGALLEIFTNEARGHIANVRQEIANCRAAGACLVSSGLTRSIHTLQGNARSLGIRMMAEACAEAEKLLHALSAQHLPLAEGQLGMLDRFAAAADDLVTAVNGGVVAPGLAERFAAVRHEARAEFDHVALSEPASADVESEQPLTEEIELIAPAEDEIEPLAPEPEAPTVAPAVARPAPAASSSPSALGDNITDPELFEIFQEEAVDILNGIEGSVRAWRARPDDRAIVPELKRALHTLKGGARMAGAMMMGHLSHVSESLLLLVEGRSVAPTTELFDLLEETHDTLVSMLDRLARGEPAPDTAALNARLHAAAGIHDETAVGAADDASQNGDIEIDFGDTIGMDASVMLEPTVSAETGAGTTAVDPERAATVVAFPERAAAERSETDEPVVDRREGDDAGGERRDRRGQVRVQTTLLNDLVNFAGEVSISRARMEQQIYGFRDNLSELNRNVVRFRDQLRELEIQSESQILYRLDQQDGTAGDFDPLEFDRFSKLQQLARSLTESLHDLSTIQMNMGNFVGEAETVLQQQARINTELQEGLMRTRMVDFSTQAARLRHIVRQTSRELGKRAELVFEGSEVQIDRTVLERMIGPFEHMIRNSLDHGIEPEDVRRRAGKPPSGTITIATAQEGSEVVLRFSDDGAGMNVEAIRAKAIERGLMSPDTNLSEDELLQFILISGFSTAEKVTQVSGRGVGMDVVHSEIKQLGGHMAVETRAGEGTSFTIRLPLTLSIAQALMVYVGDQQYAVPLSSVINIIEYPVEQLNSISMGKNPLLNYNDQVYAYMNLAARLGMPSSARNARKVPMLLARAGNREVAIQIDGLGGTREIVIKTLGAQLAEIKGLAGATILGDGRVVLILDIPGLWYGDETLRVEHRPIVVADEPKAEVRERPIVMVVDDSLTVRKVTGKHLQKRGFEVMVAKDGLDAVEQLRDRVPDVMLVDIEMPRMDGYELTSRVRAESRLKHIPIIMITSRAGAKHRQRAFDLGVDMYMSKPYQEQELFNNVDALLHNGRPEPKSS